MPEQRRRFSAQFKAEARFCRKNHVRASVGRTGVCWDNAAAESFFASLKNEMYHREPFPTRARARFAVANYIEVFGHRRPGHGHHPRTPRPGRGVSLRPRHAIHVRHVFMAECR